MRAPATVHELTRWSWLIVVASTFTVMAGSAVAPALPAIGEAFADEPGVDGLVALVPGASAVGTMVGAWAVAPLLERCGSKRVLVASLWLVGGAGGIGGLVESLPALLISRLVLGVAVAGTLTATTTWIGDRLRGELRDRVTGRHGVAMEVCGALFFAVAGILAGFDWRAPFVLYGLAVPVGVIARRLPGRARSTLAVGSGPGSGPGSGSGSGLGPGSGRRGRSARVRDCRSIWPPLLGASCGMVLFGLWTIEVPFYITQYLGGTSAFGGAALAAVTTGAAISGAMFSRLRARVELPVMLAGALLLMSVTMMGFSCLGIHRGHGGGIHGVFLVMFGVGLGFGQIMPVAIGWVNLSCPGPVRGRAQSWLTFAAFGGQVVAGLLSAWIGSNGEHGQPRVFMGAGLLGLIACAGVVRWTSCGSVARRSEHEPHV